MSSKNTMNTAERIVRQNRVPVIKANTVNGPIMNTEDLMYIEAYKRQFLIANRIITGKTDLNVVILSEDDGGVAQAQDLPAGANRAGISEMVNKKDAIRAPSLSTTPPVPLFAMDGKDVMWGDAWLTYWYKLDEQFLQLGLIAANMHECGHFLYTPNPQWAANMVNAIRVSLSRTPSSIPAHWGVKGDPADATLYVNGCLNKYMPSFIFLNMIEDFRIEWLLEVRYPGTARQMAGFAASTIAHTLKTIDEQVDEVCAKSVRRGQLKMSRTHKTTLKKLMHLQAALFCIARPALRHTQMFQYIWKRTGLTLRRLSDYTKLYDSVLTAPFSHTKDGVDEISKAATTGIDSVMTLAFRLAYMMAEDMSGLDVTQSMNASQTQAEQLGSQSKVGGSAHTEPAPQGTFHPVDFKQRKEQEDEFAKADKAHKDLGKEAAKAKKQADSLARSQAAEKAAEEAEEEQEDEGGGDEGDGDGAPASGSSSDSSGSSSPSEGGDGSSNDDGEEYEGTGSGGNGTSYGKPDAQWKPKPWSNDTGDPALDEALASASQIIEGAKSASRKTLNRMAQENRDIAFRDDIEVPSMRGNGANIPVGHEHRRLVAETTRQFRRLVEDDEPGWSGGADHGRFDVQRYLQAQGRHFDVFDQWEEGNMEASSIEAVVLLDTSGSMSRLAGEAASGAWTLKRTLEEVGGKCSVYTFSDSWNRMYSVREKADRNSVFVPYTGGSTNAFGAVRAALAKLERSTMSNKLIVMLTDGGLGDGVQVALAMVKAHDQIPNLSSALYEIDPRGQGETHRHNSERACQADPRLRNYGFGMKVVGPTCAGLARISADYVKQVAYTKGGR